MTDMRKVGVSVSTIAVVQNFEAQQQLRNYGGVALQAAAVSRTLVEAAAVVAGRCTEMVPMDSIASSVNADVVAVCAKVAVALQ